MKYDRRKLRKIKKELDSVTKKGVVAEFKEFISKGNVMNLAVGVIIGGAFQSIVNSAVNDMLMPVISLFTKGIDFSAWFIALDGNTYDTYGQAKSAGAAVISYGNFISATLNFFIMAIVIFALVKLLNRLTNPLKVVSEKDAPPKEEEERPRLCDYCKKEIDKEATRCPYCTSELDTAAKIEMEVT